MQNSAEELTEYDFLKRENQELRERLSLSGNTTDGYTDLFLMLNEGVALHTLVYDDKSVPVDYIILDVNPAYERILKFHQIILRQQLETYLHFLFQVFVSLS